MSRLPRFAVPQWVFDTRLGITVVIMAFGLLTAGLAPLLGEDEIVAVTMLFLLVVLLVSATWGYGVGLFSAIFADLLLNVFFVPPLHTVTVQEPRNVVALALFLAVAVVGASMLSLLRRQLGVAQERRDELTIMLALSRELAAAPNPQRALDVIAQAVARAVQAQQCEILQMRGREWHFVGSTGDLREVSRDDAALATAAVESGQVSRRLSDRRLGHAGIRVDRGAATDTFVPFRPPAGEPGVIHIIGALTVPAGGDLDALLHAFADEAGVAIHRARLAEEARQADALRQSDEFKSALLSSVSHDLRSPLTAIKAAVGSLRSDVVEFSDMDRKQLLATIESQTDRLTHTVTDLLDMSRLDGGAVRPNLEPVEVPALFQDVQLATQAATGGREVCVEAPEDLWVRADYGLLLRAMANLVENAAKYSTPGGAIQLRARSLPGRVRLEVADEGPGISEVDLPHIFERFYRGAEGKRVHGTGLGLAIVRAMIELCGGRVNVESSAAGSIFSVSLPPARPLK
ncbi:MAG: ATP-binding protein [Dehalococcoidia bacterium]